MSLVRKSPRPRDGCAGIREIRGVELSLILEDAGYVVDQWLVEAWDRVDGQRVSRAGTDLGRDGSID
jgi:hypothetical protein